MTRDRSGEEADALSPDEIRMLAEIGFMAARARHARAGAAVFQALQVLRPRATFVFVGLALVHLGAGQPEQAVEVLAGGLRELRDDAELKLFLGIALREAGHRAHACRHLQALLAHPTAPHVRALATSLLEDAAAPACGPAAAYFGPPAATG